MQQHGTGAKPSVPLAELRPSEANARPAERGSRRESASSADFEQAAQTEVEAAFEALKDMAHEERLEKAAEVFARHFTQLNAALKEKDAMLELQQKKLAQHEDVARRYENMEKELVYKQNEVKKQKRRLDAAERLCDKAPLSYSKFMEGGNKFFRAQIGQFLYLDTPELLRDHIKFLDSFYPLDSLGWLDTNTHEQDSGGEEAAAGAACAPSPKRRKRKFPLSPEDAVVLWLFLLRTGCSFGRAAALFHTSEQTVRRVFTTMTSLHKELFEDEFFMLEEEALRAIIPEMMKTFREHEAIDTTVAHIIDGFERPMQKPQDDEAAAACWSQYKHNYTAKFLLGILSSGMLPDSACMPTSHLLNSMLLLFTGAIYFVSDAYPGSIGDPDISRACGFLELMIRGLDVMAGACAACHSNLAPQPQI